jgi:hypothetical protein
LVLIKYLKKTPKPVLTFSGTALELPESLKYLGLSFDPNMSWHNHIDVSAKVARILNLLRRIRKYLTVDTCKCLHGSVIQPLYEYCDVLWSNANKTCLDRPLRLQKRGARIVLQNKIREERSEKLFKELGWIPLTDR